ncbi:MAG: phosphoenolpyruvate carboxykinase [Dysgonomonas mossii]|uniref:phosphoenolpyruvate carboxykinase n=1 Tax=Dysgonomonas mossii TaxID=163665 RepID=UPI001D814C20|nr:phosphoenolpyruvate carboxykinase [Dysgonomonas mossii]MBS5797519.1 phosphoenolpyruvate carboxykinase [Dysgonomonas mossii]MBS7112223.1 phosphoenolpyruvate carboxykinase [Dysgonomonas mossii]
MLHEFTLSRGRAMINFTLKYCDTKQKLLNSYGFRRVVDSFIKQFLKKEEVVIFDYYIEHFGSEDNLVDAFIEVFKLLTVFEIEEVVAVDNKYSKFFEDKDLFIEVTELLFEYWKRLERYTIVRNNRLGEGLQNVRFIQANDMFNDLILSTGRRIQTTVVGRESRIFRQSIAGANAGLTLNDVNWNCPIEYKGLTSIPFISTVVFHPPYISYTKRNTRDGIFQEHQQNPIQNLVLNEDDWFVFPAKVGNMLTFVYFHKDFMVHGVGLSNLFEIATENEYIGKKPDMIYIFGYPDGHEEKRTFYYKDKKNDILIGYANYCDDIDYFGYMKKMLLTLHNVKQIENERLPIHGAMVNIVLRNGKESNIIIMGDSGAGKSESLEAFRTLNENYIRHMRVIFDDMGYLKKEEDGTIKAYGTEIGAFVRVDDLDPAYAFAQLDRGVYTNMDRVNARVTIPISTYEIISRGYPIDYFLYANNYNEAEKKILLYNDLDKAIPIFEDGARKAKGTTTEKGLVKSYFANPFGPVQEREATEKLVRSYFSDMKKAGVKIGEIHTSLAIEGKAKDGPREAAEELFSLINE